MKLKNSVMTAAMVATLMFGYRLSAQTTFDFQFNDTPLSLGTGPTVGTGTFIFATDPGDGTFPLADLGAFTMNFDFTGGVSFDQTDISSDPTQVLVVLSTSGSTRRLQFSNLGFDGGGSGPFPGSLSLSNGPSLLAFEPSSQGNGLQTYQEFGLTFDPFSFTMYNGDYLATEAPSANAPDNASTFWLLSSTMGLVLCVRLQRTRFALQVNPCRRSGSQPTLVHQSLQDC